MAFSAVSNSEIAADAPFTQALARKFADNLAAHNHSAGQGAVLSEASFEAGSISGDAVNTSTKLTRAIGATVKAFVSGTATDFFPAGSGLIEDTAFKFTVVALVPSMLLAFYQLRIASVTGSPNIEIGFLLNGVRMDTTVRLADDDTTDKRTAPLMVGYALVAAGTHTLTPFILNTSTAQQTVTVANRQASYRLFATV